MSTLQSEGAAYPEPLKQAERQLLDARQGGAIRERPTGVALSGGGIRSAIFALGLFQTLAKKKLLRRVDYLSTVSGGGYFGGFFTALFSRPDYVDFESVQRALRAESEPLKYLRRNGRYLAPAGTHDLLLGLSVLLRNWLTVLSMTVALLMSAFLTLEWMPHFVRHEFELDGIWQLTKLGDVESFAIEQGVWLSGWVLPCAAILVGIAVPLGWAYFTLGRPGPATDGAFWKVRDALKPGVALSHSLLVALGLELLRDGRTLPAAALIGLTGMTAASAMAAELWLVLWSAWRDKLPQGGRFWRWIWMPVAFLLGLLAAAVPFLLVREITSTRSSDSYLTIATDVALLWILTMVVRGMVSALVKQAGAISAVNLDQYPRHTVSSWLKTWLVAAGCLLLLALIQSAGRTLYVLLQQDLGWVLSSLGAALASAAGFAKRLVVKLGEKPDGKRSRGFPAVFQYAAGGLVAAALLVAASAVAASVTYADSPLIPPLGKPIARQMTLGVAEVAERAGAWALAFVGVSLAFGFSRRLLNNSTHSPLYSARITRTFLGASNSQRTGSARDEGEVQRGAATHLMRDDDLMLADYFRHPHTPATGAPNSPAKRSPYEKGAPLHLINVTINETVDGRSGMHEPDAKGIGLAVGPCGLSAGVRHHAVFAWGEPEQPEILPERADYRVFQHAPPEGSRFARLLWRARAFPSEQLSVGQWLGVSGAAFTTGLGWRTNAGLSFLAGITNIRLGHWWRPGIWRRLTVTRALGVLFWVQQYLAREFSARFPGTANTLWYLSDGGHFENTGAYELIRRKAELILLVDAEADATYEFEGLAHLVCKARIDFGAEIRFLTRDDPEFNDLIHFDVLDRFGSLDELRRGSWKRDVRLLKNGHEAPRLDEDGFTLDEVSLEALSRAHAALAVIEYCDGSAGYLVYVKPTLTGTEPIDVARYHTEHPSFPQETTADQFFDEAQWESYRKLGEHIGERVFAAGWPIAIDTSEYPSSPGASDTVDDGEGREQRPEPAESGTVNTEAGSADSHAG